LFANIKKSRRELYLETYNLNCSFIVLIIIAREGGKGRERRKEKEEGTENILNVLAKKEYE